jgi:hypothetical protein
VAKPLVTPGLFVETGRPDAVVWLACVVENRGSVALSQPWLRLRVFHGTTLLRETEAVLGPWPLPAGAEITGAVSLQVWQPVGSGLLTATVEVLERAGGEVVAVLASGPLANFETLGTVDVFNAEAVVLFSLDTGPTPPDQPPGTGPIPTIGLEPFSYLDYRDPAAPLVRLKIGINNIGNFPAAVRIVVSGPGVGPSGSLELRVEDLPIGFTELPEMVWPLSMPPGEYTYAIEYYDTSTSAGGGSGFGFDFRALTLTVPLPTGLVLTWATPEVQLDAGTQTFNVRWELQNQGTRSESARLTLYRHLRDRILEGVLDFGPLEPEERDVMILNEPFRGLFGDDDYIAVVTALPNGELLGVSAFEVDLSNLTVTII